MNDVVCVFDHAFYAKGMDLYWKRKELFVDLHGHNNNGLRSNWKPMGDAALKELAVQSDVVAERHVDKALNRKRYSKLCIFINLCMKPS